MQQKEDAVKLTARLDAIESILRKEVKNINTEIERRKADERDWKYEEGQRDNLEYALYLVTGGAQ